MTMHCCVQTAAIRSQKFNMQDTSRLLPTPPSSEHRLAVFGPLSVGGPDAKSSEELEVPKAMECMECRRKRKAAEEAKGEEATSSCSSRCQRVGAMVFM